MKNILLFLKVLFVISILLGQWGCANVSHIRPLPFRINVDSLSDSAPMPGQHYILKSGMEGIIENDLHFREFSKYIDTALIERGYIKSTKQEDTDIIIFFQYGISEPQTKQYVSSTPIYGIKGGGSATINSSTIDNYGGYSHTTGTVSAPNEYGIIGTKQNTSYTTAYARYFKLDAVDNKIYQMKGEIIPLFQITVKSVGRSNDLRRVFPIMVGAAAPYFGENTGEQLTIKLRENDPSVLKIKGIQPKN